MSNEVTYNARVMTGYRVTIPTLERELLGIDEGDIVIVKIVKVSPEEQHSKECQEKMEVPA